jgi:carbonic anhydrase
MADLMRARSPVRLPSTISSIAPFTAPQEVCPKTKFDGEKSSKNDAYVDAVTRTNVGLALAEIRRRSPILEDLEKKGSIQIAGAMYHLSSGMVEFLS